MLRLALTLVLPALAILVAERVGLLVQIGAHPFWSLKGAAMGVGIGLAITLALVFLRRWQRVSPALLTLVFAFLALSAAVLMLNGKEGFAASYAADAAAGRFWYFGYIGVIATAYAAMAALLDMLLAPRRQQR